VILAISDCCFCDFDVSGWDLGDSGDLGLDCW